MTQGRSNYNFGVDLEKPVDCFLTRRDGAIARAEVCALRALSYLDPVNGRKLLLN